MLKSHVINSSTTNGVQVKFNQALSQIPEDRLVDVKLTGASSGDNEMFMAVIIYRTS